MVTFILKTISIIHLQRIQWTGHPTVPNFADKVPFGQIKKIFINYTFWQDTKLRWKKYF